jgi:tetratricopeptide (TPR) repeat protein
LRANFGELLRLDLSRQLEQLGDRAVPALLEARAHDAAVVQRFAAVELDRRGKVTPQEAVGTADPDVLADTLRAFGRLREVDATSILIGFANHDRRKVRDAAREAIGAIGEAGRWRLRDAYLDLSGDKPDKSLGWDLLARRIFHLYDRARFLELEELVARATTLAKEGKHSEATAVFDQVLARDPLVDERAAMAASYAIAARTLQRDEEQLAMLRKARLLDPRAPDATKLDAQIAFLEARLMAASGRPDRFLLDRALELDPSHDEAKALRDAQRQPTERALPPSRRPLYAAVLGAASLAVAALVAFARRTTPTTIARPHDAPPSA